ncbi:MAG: hypothetical protein IPJ82_09770 [Lewinellaceae bacterium]|nr:hypothetical protein [Lewinellaceae bacterium]
MKKQKQILFSDSHPALLMNEETKTGRMWRRENESSRNFRSFIPVSVFEVSSRKYGGVASQKQAGMGLYQKSLSIDSGGT